MRRSATSSQDRQHLSPRQTQQRRPTNTQALTDGLSSQHHNASSRPGGGHQPQEQSHARSSPAPSSTAPNNTKWQSQPETAPRLEAQPHLQRKTQNDTTSRMRYGSPSKGKQQQQMRLHSHLRQFAHHPTVHHPYAVPAQPDRSRVQPGLPKAPPSSPIHTRHAPAFDEGSPRRFSARSPDTKSAGTSPVTAPTQDAPNRPHSARPSSMKSALDGTDQINREFHQRQMAAMQQHGILSTPTSSSDTPTTTSPHASASDLQLSEDRLVALLDHAKSLQNGFEEIQQRAGQVGQWWKTGHGDPARGAGAADVNPREPEKATASAQGQAVRGPSKKTAPLQQAYITKKDGEIEVRFVPVTDPAVLALGRKPLPIMSGFATSQSTPLLSERGRRSLARGSAPRRRASSTSSRGSRHGSVLSNSSKSKGGSNSQLARSVSAPAVDVEEERARAMSQTTSSSSESMTFPRTGTSSSSASVDIPPALSDEQQERQDKQQEQEEQQLMDSIRDLLSTTSVGYRKDIDEDNIDGADDSEEESTLGQQGDDLLVAPSPSPGDALANGDLVTEQMNDDDDTDLTEHLMSEPIFESKSNEDDTDLTQHFMSRPIPVSKPNDDDSDLTQHFMSQPIPESLPTHDQHAYKVDHNNHTNPWRGDGKSLQYGPLYGNGLAQHGPDLGLLPRENSEDTSPMKITPAKRNVSDGEQSDSRNSTGSSDGSAMMVEGPNLDDCKQT
ncbi:hypothetical protein BC832DRAFT_538466 [Gaertneriomyces semiglobifer]|nr:hypothetical protein BC832DRAFT_538466 [Gaertneriomyces semiglobifer]